MSRFYSLTEDPDLFFAVHSFLSLRPCRCILKLWFVSLTLDRFSGVHSLLLDLRSCLYIWFVR
ncbi:unnamed protein product [Arabidopsis halleri]